VKTFISAVIAVFIFTACHNHDDAHTEDPDLDHDHENVSILFSQYNNNYELFAECNPMVAGEEVEILAHFTHLSDFKPLLDGAVTVNLLIGTEKISQKQNKPLHPGIYSFQLQPESAGKGQLVFDIETQNGKSSFTINDIEVFADEHEAIHEAEENTEVHPNAITFTKEQSWKIDFATDLPKVEPFGEVIKTTARVQSAQSEEIILTAKASGIVQFKNNNLTEGASVSRGKVLFSVSAESLVENNMNVRYIEAKNNYEKAEADYKRKSQLAKDKLVSQNELQDSKAEYENSRIRFENLNKNFNKSGQDITSSNRGFVKHIYISNGEYVEAGQPLVSITENRNLFLKAEVQQKYANALPYIKTANIHSMNDNAVYSLEELNGKVISYAKNVSDESFLIPVTLQVENRAGIFPGSFMELFIVTESKKDALTVPNNALVEEQGNFAVFVQLNPESFEKREVKTGKTDGMRTEILSGLNPDDRIVTKGSILVKLAAVSNSLDPHAGHVH